MPESFVTHALLPLKGWASFVKAPRAQSLAGFGTPAVGNFAVVQFESDAPSKSIAYGNALMGARVVAPDVAPKTVSMRLALRALTSNVYAVDRLSPLTATPVERPHCV